MIRLIVALDQKRGIAKNGVQPWYIPADEKYFTEQTKKFGGVVLVGSKTFETFNGPLADRKNFVLSGEKGKAEGVTYVNDMDKFLDEQSGDVWVVGGASVFSQTIHRADELYVTKIQADFKCDQFFPEYEAAFELVETSDMHTENGFIFTYNIYKTLT